MKGNTNHTMTEFLKRYDFENTQSLTRGCLVFNDSKSPQLGALCYVESLS